MPPVTSRKVRHPASTAASPAFLEIFDWQECHLRPAVVLSASWGVQGQSFGDAMRSFVIVRAYDLQSSASKRGPEERWCWWDDFVGALGTPGMRSEDAGTSAAADLAAAEARLAHLESSIAQFIRSVS